MAKRDRVHTPESIKAAAHPTRQTILRLLEERDLSTIDLERQTGENRYNLYHHLQKLQEVGLIESRLSDGRAKSYHLAEPSDTRELFFRVEISEIKDPRMLETALAALSGLLGREISDPDLVSSLSVFIEYAKSKRR